MIGGLVVLSMKYGPAIDALLSRKASPLIHKIAKWISWVTAFLVIAFMGEGIIIHANPVFNWIIACLGLFQIVLMIGKINKVAYCFAAVELILLAFGLYGYLFIGDMSAGRMPPLDISPDSFAFWVALLVGLVLFTVVWICLKSAKDLDW
jgi:hypothetical protein